METSPFKTAIEKDLRERGRRRTIAIVAGLGMAALLAGGIALTQFAGMEPIPEVVEEVAPVDYYQGVALTAQAAIVYDLAKGEVLFQKNADAQLPLASLTKLLTVYAAADALARTAVVPITFNALAEEGDSGFVYGDTFTFEDLARLTLVSSSNDGASAIAEAAGQAHASSGSSLLASAAQAAGLSQTYAVNGTGLDESGSVSGGYGSAHDVALLSGALLAAAPDLAKATTESSISVTSREGKAFTEKNTNQEIPAFPGALLSKTGFTDLAGGNLAVVYDAGINHPIAIVVLGSTREGRFTDVERLLSRTLNRFASL
ncbi:serine hydrolase [Patescibacteria group bacterium]|nr:serine hydrolase [Patescibacteria group bacterium]